MKYLLYLAVILSAVCLARANSEGELAELIEEILRRHGIGEKLASLNEERLQPESTSTEKTTASTPSTTASTPSTPASTPSTTASTPSTTASTPSTTTSTPSTTTRTTQSAVRKVEVYAQLEEVWGTIGKSAQLFCQYSLSTGEDRPVTVTWKVGDGPRSATPILICRGWTHTYQRCSSIDVVDAQFQGRARLALETPSLEITKVEESDNRNFWCQVSLEDSVDYELEFDMKSMVLRLYEGSATPKFHSVEVDDDIAATAGGNISIGCVCHGYHCEDVVWYKGPIDQTYSNYEMIYSRTSHSRPVPTQYKAYNQWVGRAYLTGNSLNLLGVGIEDSGRYWCEIRSSGFYAIGEWATDAKSMLLEVREKQVGEEPFDCLTKPDGLYADPQSCAGYYECVASEAHIRNCPAGTIFNPDINSHPHYACDFAEYVAPPCGTIISR